MKKISLMLFFLFVSIGLVCAQGSTQSQNHDNLFSEMDRLFTQAEYVPTPLEEYFLGRAVAANILSKYNIYNGNPSLTRYLNLICQSLVINSARSAVFGGYHVAILDSREINAFATPGGHIFITKALVEAAASEDALAAIIAHELAHIMLKHGMKLIEEDRINVEIDIVSQRAAAFSGSRNSQILEFRDSVNNYFNSMVINGYSQEQEFEADITALSILAAAGYLPRGLLDMLSVLRSVQANQNDGFYNTHPAPVQRISNVQRHVNNYRVRDTSSSRRERFNRNMGRR